LALLRHRSTVAYTAAFWSNADIKRQLPDMDLLVLMEHGTNGTSAKPGRYRPRMHDPDKLARQLAGWASAPFVQEQRQAHARELTARGESTWRQREVDGMAAALRRHDALQRHQQDVARFNALADALLNPKCPTEW
jgi:hypothetical protein